MDTYGLLGYPLKHSFSRLYFTEKFQKEAIDAQYLNFEIPDIASIENIIAEHPTLKGLNVTIPHKEKVIPFLDELDDNAKQIGAVNVIEIQRTDGKIKLIGHNSDVLGFQHSIAPLIHPQVHTKALVLGTGGASKAIVQGLKNLGIESKYVSRTRRENVFSYQDLDEAVMAAYTVIVNASPVGTYPHMDECPDIPYKLLNSNYLLFDVVYNPAETVFLRQGREQGAQTKNGAEMLQLQAKAAWDFWAEKK